MEMSELRFSCGTLKSSHEQEQTERDCTRHIHLEDIVSTNSKQDDLKQSTVNTELFLLLFGLSFRDTQHAGKYLCMNKRVNNLPEYLQCNENWQWI